MARKQTSPKMSSLAAKVLQMNEEQIKQLPISDIRSLAASVLSQDETPGNPIKRFFKALKG